LNPAAASSEIQQQRLSFPQAKFCKISTMLRLSAAAGAIVGVNGLVLKTTPEQESQRMAKLGPILEQLRGMLEFKVQRKRKVGLKLEKLRGILF
jgi:hypothetical protein